MEKHIRRYKAWVLFNQFMSAGVMLFGLAAVIVYFDEVPADHSQLYEGHVIWLLSGLLFLGLGIALLWISHRRSRRSLWVVANTSPVDMLLTLEVEDDADSTSYYAVLRNAHDVKPRWRACVDPTFSARPLVGVEVRARVFVDPKLGTPAAIKVAEGVLWANPLFQRAEID